jgi:hypothetical protein
MYKMNKVAKLMLGTLLISSLSGCVMDGMTKPSSGENGVFYGMALKKGGMWDAKTLCNSVPNTDARCAHTEDYEVIMVLGQFSYEVGMGGEVGIMALVKKDFKGLDVLKSNEKMSKKAPYAKAKITPNKFGEVLAVVSTNNDRVCFWKGQYEEGGTICPSFNYDYHNNFHGIRTIISTE